MHKNPKTAHKNAQKRSENFQPFIHNFVSTGMNLPKYGLLCVLMALLGSQSIVVKCTAAIFSVQWILTGSYFSSNSDAASNSPSVTSAPSVNQPLVHKATACTYMYSHIM